MIKGDKKMDKVKAGVVGLGLKGWLYDEDPLRSKPESHVGALVSNEDVDLVAVCDVDEEKLERFNAVYPGVKTYKNFEDMMFKSRLDLLCVASPVQEHEKHVRLACRYDYVKVILVEKPIAGTLEEADLMLYSCKQYNVKLAVNHQRRWDKTWVETRNILDKKAGKVFKVVGFCSGDPLEAGVHMADLFNWFGPEAEQVYVDLEVETPYNPYLIFELHVFGEKGRVRIFDNGRCVEVEEVASSGRYGGVKELNSGYLTRSGPPGTPMVAVIRDMVECVRTSKQPECSGNDGLKALIPSLVWKEGVTN